MTTVAVPLLRAAKGTSACHDFGDVMVSVAPVPYATVPEVQESAEDVGRVVDTDWHADGAVTATPVRLTLMTAAAVPVVRPDRVAFAVVVTNRSARVLYGRGAKVRFLVPGQPPVLADGLGLAAVAVPPGGRERVTVYGPRLSRIAAGTAVGLELRGVPTTTDAAGEPGGRRDVACWFTFRAREWTTSTVPDVGVVGRADGPTAVVAPPPPGYGRWR